MEPTPIFNLYSYNSDQQLRAATDWTRKIRKKINPLNSSAARMSALFEPVLRSVTRSFLFAADRDESLKAEISLYESQHFPRLTLSRVFEAVSLDICKEILSENDINIAARLLCGAPKNAVKLLRDVRPIAA